MRIEVKMTKDELKAALKPWYPSDDPKPWYPRRKAGFRTAFKQDTDGNYDIVITQADLHLSGISE